MTKKLCIVTPSLDCGGLQRVVSVLANYCSSKGYGVSLVSLSKSDIYYPICNGVRVYMPTTDCRGSLSYKIRTFLFLISSIISIKPDCVLGFGEVFNPLTIIASRITFNKVFISDRSSPNKNFKSGYIKLRRFIYPFAHGVIAQTKLAKEKLDTVNNNVKVIPNPLRDINDTIDKCYGKSIVTAGRLVASKNFDRLIDIFSNLKDSDDWNLIILGDGPQKKDLEYKIDSLGLSNKVFLKGDVKNIDKYYALSSIFAFTSLSEGFPNALSEAMAFPLACISYDCVSGPSDIIEDKNNGFLVSLNDEDEFKRILQELIDNSELRNKITSHAVLNREKYSKERICEELLNIIF